jgi:nucleoside-diphosphate-sugar epimerase
MSGKHIVIGGLGNLGRHLQRALLENGCAVRVLDRPATISKAGEHKSVERIPFTLGWDDPQELCKALEGAETVYSVVTPDVQYGTAQDFYRTNQLGMKHLVQACKSAGVPKLVYASSLAVTNHFVSSRNQSEDDPLPPIESYVTSYDKTKRIGEETVLAAHDGNNLHTCSLRLGAILASHTDYMLRKPFAQGEQSGRIITVNMQPIDAISARDISRALWSANDKLTTEKAIQGQALFVTKSRNETVPSGTEVSQLLGALMQWQVQVMPPWLVSAVRAGTWLQHTVTAPFQTEEMGMPPHLYLDITKYEQTFDNTRARTVLDFTPEDSWQDAVERIVRDYKDNKKR